MRILKIMLVLTVAAWGFLGAFGNLIDWEGTTGAVSAATSMSTFEETTARWKATTNPGIILAGALFIVLSKLIAAILCTAGALRMWGARRADSVAFHAAKGAALAGCAVAVFMLFGGFIVIAETWFEMWRSDAMRDISLQSAFRYAGMITLIALFVGARED